MERKCSRCNVQLVEDYTIVGGDKKSLTLSKEGICGLSLNHVKVAVCPKCGKIELYVEPESLDSNF